MAFVKAFAQLLRFELLIARGDFFRLQSIVRDHSVRDVRVPDVMVQDLCSAIDAVCVLYWKEVRCLQRSAATVCLLKSYGVPAELVIGAQHLPFKAHAWVEVAGRVVNDRPFMREIYSVVDHR
jgi:hypothetical protein